MAPWSTRKPVATEVSITQIVPDSPTGTVHSAQSDSGWQSLLQKDGAVLPTLLLDAASPLIKQCDPSELARVLETLKSLALPIRGLDASPSHVGPTQSTQESESSLQNIPQQSDLAVGTKVCTRGNHLGFGNGELHAHQIRESLQRSLRQTRHRNVSWLIAQRPDSSVALGELTAGFEALLQEGMCNSWGVKDFQTRQLRDLLMTCRRRQLAGPSIYQSKYNFLSRADLEERIPLIREHGMCIHAYEPLAAGVLSDTTYNIGAWQSHDYRSNSRENAKAIAELASRHGLSLQDVALRWLAHHSILSNQDAIILTASSMDDLSVKVSSIAQGPLPREVVILLDQNR